MSFLHDYQGQPIEQREDGYFNATQMCKAAGKLFADWQRLDTTHEYLEALSKNMGIPIFKLVEAKKGRSNYTWIHPKAAIHLAQWLSPQFAVFVTDVVMAYAEGRLKAVLDDPTIPTWAKALISYDPYPRTRMLRELYTELARLMGREGKRGFPPYVGKLVREIYAKLHQSIPAMVDEINPRPEGGRRKNCMYQHLKPETLVPHIGFCTNIARNCSSIQQFKHLLGYVGYQPGQVIQQKFLLLA